MLLPQTPRMPSRFMIARHAEGSPDAGLGNFAGGARSFSFASCRELGFVATSCKILSSIDAEELVIPISKMGSQIPKLIGGRCLSCICFYADQDSPQLLNHTSCALSPHCPLLSPASVAAGDGPIRQVMKPFWFLFEVFAGFTAIHFSLSFLNLLTRCLFSRLVRVEPLDYDPWHRPPSRSHLRSQSHNSQPAKFDGVYG